MTSSVRAHAPVRVADVGGWTDTWFAGSGRVCSVSVEPGVSVWASLREDGAPGSVRLLAPDVGVDLVTGPGETRGWAAPEPDRHPLLEHAVGAILERRALPDGASARLEIASAVPPGASLGTSSAVAVAVLDALSSLLGEPISRPELATLAHDVETRRCGREAGVQDPWGAALGGANLLDIESYPQVIATPVLLPEAARERFDATCRTVIFGGHDSSAVHEEVIAAVVGDDGPAAVARAALARLVALADEAARALTLGDLPAWGAALTEATNAQERLHPALVGAPHRAGIAVADGLDALGWKVNGAGGDGGSLTVLLRDPESADGFAEAMRARGWRVPTLRLAARL